MARLIEAPLDEVADGEKPGPRRAEMSILSLGWMANLYRGPRLLRDIARDPMTES